MYYASGSGLAFQPEPPLAEATFGGRQQQQAQPDENNNRNNNPSSGMDRGMVATGQASVQVIASMHQDYIHRVCFDTYGRRMATCASDKVVRVWDLQDGSDDGAWALAASWPAHRGAVTDVAWAHPEFGPLLATAGSDHDAKIWEERHVLSGGSSSAHQQQQQATPSAASTSRWVARASLTDARRAVTCLQFAPRHWGLKLAVGSADGGVRIYEAVDIMNLAQWPLAATLQPFVGTDASTAGGSSSSIAGGGGALGASEPQSNGASARLGCTCLSWCTGRFEPPTLVVGGSHLVVYRYAEAARDWQILMHLPALYSTGSPNMTTPGDPHYSGGDVLDVSWAPNVGRRFHYIAAAQDGHLVIYKLARASGGDNATPSKYALSLVDTRSVDCNAWRCQWNVTGTVLASTGDGGMVQLWKSNADGDFVCVSEVRPPPPMDASSTTAAPPGAAM